jgi:hypothetical protein
LRLKLIITALLIFLIHVKNNAQSDTTNTSVRNYPKPDSSKLPPVIIPDSSHAQEISLVSERDLKDVVHYLFKHRQSAHEGNEAQNTRPQFSFIPAVGYTLQTGFAGAVSGNLAYYNDRKIDSKISTVGASITYSQYRQTIIPFQANIWTKGNLYNVITDLRYVSYPSSIYGLGGRTDPNKGVTINFSSIKIHQTLMRSLSNNIYLGVGYYFDRFWKIYAQDKVSRTENIQIAKELGKDETASGAVFRFLYDTRLNQINPQQGTYYSVIYRSNFRTMGSDSNSNDLQIDARTYFHFPATSKNVLALWMFDWLTVNGTPPYLLLPSTGWDNNYNTGRGYIQGRFRGRKMLYFESEYRFVISPNGLLGGVVFVNVQNFSSDLSPQYSNIFPGYGFGARIKLNKFSRTNLCIDYGFGKNGSQGFFVNLGEVF